MLKNLKNNNNGIVFVTVLIMIIVSMVLVISALSLNISQSKSSERELKLIQAEILAEGGMWQIFTNQLDASPGTSMIYTETIGNMTFTINADIDSGGSGPAGSSSVPMDITVSF